MQQNIYYLVFIHYQFQQLDLATFRQKYAKHITEVRHCDSLKTGLQMCSYLPKLICFS